MRAGVVTASALLCVALGLNAADFYWPTQAAGEVETPRGLLRGVNLYTLEQQRMLAPEDVKPDAQASFDYLARKGFNVVRLDVSWQQIVPIPTGSDPASAVMGEPSSTYLQVIHEEVAQAGRAGLQTVIDLHNGCVYPWAGAQTPQGAISCGHGVTSEAVAHVWSVIATSFKDDQSVAGYDLFNEPRISIGVEDYEAAVQSAVTAIRQASDTHRIWVESMIGGSGGDLSAFAPKGPWVTDPLNNLEYSQHFYVDKTGLRGLTRRLQAFTDWCARWSEHCSAGEIGWKQNAPSPEIAAFQNAYNMADEKGLDVTYFGASSLSKPNGYIAYGSSGRKPMTIDTSGPQAAVVEAHNTRPPDNSASRG